MSAFRKKVILGMILFCLILGLGLIPQLFASKQAECSAWHPCGAWCETFGDCGESGAHCGTGPNYVYCECNGVRVYYYC
jgi:hypothetical protein